MKRYSHIVWDWNGTLIDDTWLCHEIANFQLAGRGKPALSFEEYRRRLRFPIKEFMIEVGLVEPGAAHDTQSHDFHRVYIERRLECALHPGAEAVLSSVRDSGMSQSILSAHPQPLLDFGVDHYNLREHFTDVVGQPDSLVQSKVSLACEWLAQSGLTPASMLMVGDTDHDYEVAQAMGVDCVLIPNGVQDRSRLEAVGAKLLPSISDLIGHL